jgi:outer membrane lipoprotein carrier protein
MKKVIMLMLFVCSSTVWCQNSGDLLQNKLNAMRSMSAQFSQVVKSKNREVSRSAGIMALERPGRFRWQTKTPMEQLVVADGQKMWIYDVDLEQVTVKKQEKGLGGTAALFLSGYGDNVARDFEVVEKNEGNTLVFDLKAKSAKENFQHIQLTFTQNQLTGLQLHDQLGQTTSVTLDHIKTNSQLSSQLFQFKPPKGVDVVKQ